MGRHGKAMCECGKPALAFPPKGRWASQRAKAKQPYRIKGHWLCQRCKDRQDQSLFFDRWPLMNNRYDGGAALDVEQPAEAQPTGPTREQLFAEFITASRLGAGKTTEWAVSTIDRLLAQCERSATLETMVRSLSDRVKQQHDLLGRLSERDAAGKP
jgi:hypothetical protein